MTIKFEGCFYSFNPPSPAGEMHLPGAGLGGSKISPYNGNPPRPSQREGSGGDAYWLQRDVGVVIEVFGRGELKFIVAGELGRQLHACVRGIHNCPENYGVAAQQG